MADRSDIARALRQHGASVQSTENKTMPGLLVGYGGKTHLLHVSKPEELHFFVATWRGEPVQFVTSVDEALAAVGIGSRWTAWRLNCEQYILDAIRTAMRYKGTDVIYAKDVFPHQSLYKSERGLTRFMTSMVERKRLVRLSRTGYSLPGKAPILNS